MQTISNSFHMVGRMMHHVNLQTTLTDLRFQFSNVTHQIQFSKIIMEIQVQGNFTTVLEVVRQIVMTPFSEAATGAALQKSVLKNFAKFTRKHLCRCLLIEKETPTQVLFCFSVNLAKFLRTTCLQISSGRLPLYFIE